MRSDEVRPEPGSRSYGREASTAGPGDPHVELGPRGGEGPSVPISGGPRGEAPAGSASASVDDFARLGFNARRYLSGEVPRLVIEVDAQRGFEPAPEALGTLRARLEEVADKPDGIEVLPVETFTGGRSSWTEADVLEAQRRHRDHWSSPQAMVLYILYVDGVYAEDEGSLGVSFNSSTFAMFVGEIRRSAATPLVPALAIERAVLVHEAGHILALVNIGYTSPRGREDPNHPAHSTNPDSVMYWAVDNVGVASLVRGRTTPPTQFDAADKADLEDLKEGRLGIE